MAMDETDVDAADFMRVLRDITTCAEFPEVTAALGLIPPGADVERLEHAEAHLRKAAMMAVAEEVVGHASVIASLMWIISGEPTGGDRETYEKVAQRTAIGVVTHLVDRGLVEVVPSRPLEEW
ncbi:hypothetical protein ACFVGM_08735 [Kitasatospora purpeofusca]|uniref:hypothetical protein n=1 Tax=Kitasatospora purpeofusca TaxID=67352 RepID=UPI003679FE86